MYVTSVLLNEVNFSADLFNVDIIITCIFLSLLLFALHAWLNKRAGFIHVPAHTLCHGVRWPLGWSRSGSTIQDHSDHGASKDLRHPCLEWIPRFLWCIMIRVILDHWSWSIWITSIINNFVEKLHWDYRYITFHPNSLSSPLPSFNVAITEFLSLPLAKKNKFNIILKGRAKVRRGLFQHNFLSGHARLVINVETLHRDQSPQINNISPI